MEAIENSRCSLGVEGLDRVLGGGLPRDRIYVVEGEPGTGKTTLALQFLLDGAKRGERTLYITFSETKLELAEAATSHGWDISQIDLVDLSAVGEHVSPESHTTLFRPSEVELNKVFEFIMSQVERIQPERIVFDSASEMRLLSESPLRYRRLILAFKQAFVGRRCTVLFLDDLSSSTEDLQVKSIAHGVIGLFRVSHDFGSERRRLRISKIRGVDFSGGYHDFVIQRGGISVFPRLLPQESIVRTSVRSLPSKIKELDRLLGSGLDFGSCSLFMGPAGSGKSSLAMQYVLAGAEIGQYGAYFTFDETVSNVINRCEGLSMPVRKVLEEKRIRIDRIDPAEMSPGHFACGIRELVEKKGYRIIVIDSLNGYLQAAQDDRYLTVQLHELLNFLSNLGVLTILVLAQQGMIGSMQTPIDLSYLADTVILTRYFEAKGEVRKAISVVKKRTGKHESTIRELAMDKMGLRVGPVLEQFSGILTGVPIFAGGKRQMLKGRR